jgi:hypothetical protein
VLSFPKGCVLLKHLAAAVLSANMNPVILIGFAANESNLLNNNYPYLIDRRSELLVMQVDFGILMKRLEI